MKPSHRTAGPKTLSLAPVSQGWSLKALFLAPLSQGWPLLDLVVTVPSSVLQYNTKVLFFICIASYTLFRHQPDKCFTPKEEGINVELLSYTRIVRNDNVFRKQRPHSAGFILASLGRRGAWKEVDHQMERIGKCE